MAFKKRLQASYGDPEEVEHHHHGLSSHNAGPSDPNSVFVDSFVTNINYKSDQAFDFEAYKAKIVKGLEIFGEDITNLKSNMNHLFGIVDVHIYKDFYDVTNELVAITQMKLDGVITKSSSEAKNFNEHDLSHKIVHKLRTDEYRHAIQHNLSHLQHEIAEFLNEDRNYRRTNFSISDLSILLEKVFKLYDVFESENGVINFLRIDDSTLYEKVFQDQTEVAYPDLVSMNIPALQDRLGPGKVYRTPAALTKERLLFRVNEIINDKMESYTITNISGFVRAQLLREKYNLKNNLIGLFQKVLPEGLKLPEDAEHLKKEIVEELQALREGIAYLETHQKAYITIQTGHYHPEFVANLSFSTANLDILLDIEKLFFIIDDITSRISSTLKKVKQYQEIEARSIEGAVKKAIDDVIEYIRKNQTDGPSIQSIMDEIFHEINELLDKEKHARHEFLAEKERIDEERRHLERHMEARIEERANFNPTDYRGTGKPPGYETSKPVGESKETSQKTLKREEERIVRNEVEYKPQPFGTLDRPAEKKVETNVVKSKPVEVPAATTTTKKEEKPLYGSYGKEEQKPYSSPYEPYKPSTTTPVKEEKKPLGSVEKPKDDFKPSSLKMPPVEEKKPATTTTAPTTSFGQPKNDPKKPLSGYDIAKEVDNIYDELKKDGDSKKDKGKTNFFEGLNDEDDFDYMGSSSKIKPAMTTSATKTTQPTQPIKEQPKVVKKEEPVSKLTQPTQGKSPANWDVDFEEEDLDEPAYQPKKAEPSLKLPEPKKTGGLEPLGKASQPLGKLEPLGGAKNEPAKDQKPSAVDKLFSKLEEKPKEDPKKAKDFDDDIDEDYDYEFDSDTEQKGAKNSSPKKDSPAKDKANPVGASAAGNKAPALNAVVTADKLDLVNEHIEQEAGMFNQPIDPEALNELDVLIMLFQEFYSQLQLFVFDYPETDNILAETKEDVKGFKKINVSKAKIKEIAESLKNFYREMLPTETQIHEQSRFFLPFGPQEERIPFLVEVDIENQAFTYLYFGDVPKDKDSDNFIKEFHSLLKDVMAQVFDGKNQKKIDACNSYKVGLDASSQATVGPFEQAAYIRVMLIVYYLVYETNKITKNITVSIDGPMLNRFFCTLTSLNYLRRIIEGQAWDQYSEYYLAMVEQLSDGKEILAKYLPFESTGTDVAMVQKKVEKELQTVFASVKNGTKEAFVAVDIVQPEAKSVYYLYITSQVEPKVPKKDIRILLFTLTANEAQYDSKVEKIVQDLDKSGKTELVVYKDYLRHNLNYQYPAVTLGSWLMLTKQNQFAPEESMVLIIYNMNGFHLEVQAEGEEGDEGDEGGMAARKGQEDDDDYEGVNDFEEMPVEDIEDDF